MTHYVNMDGTSVELGLRSVLKWQMDRLARGVRARASRAPGVPQVETPRRDNDGSPLRAMTAHATWIGHATFVMRLGGKLVATDPIWSARIGTLGRRAAPGVDFARVPPLDVVTISHSHYDHLDMPTLARIGANALYVVPKDNGDLLRRRGLRRVVELGWWESHTVDDLKITCVPAQHWSFRYPWDRNARLWGGFVFESREGTAYHAGDTAYSAEVFVEIANRFPRIDWAMIPIGAYDPEWFMRSQHLCPEDAGRAWELLGAQRFVAMHWGTFALTDEPLGEPPERLRAWWSARGIDPDRLWILDVGETRPLSSRR